MDLSAVIFVALAVAWAVYLVPKALKHHDEVASSRSVDRFSATMRTLARRDAVAATSSGGRAVVTPGRPASTAEVTTKPHATTITRDALADLTPAQRRARRKAAQLAARRRRRVLLTLLAGVVVAVATSSVALTSWWLVALPGGLIVMWLVACRAMVRGERRRRTVVVRTDSDGVPVEIDEVDGDLPTSYDVLRTDEGFDEVGPVAETSTIDPSAADPELWAPRPITLPTYVGKDQAPMRQYVLTKDETGVWSAGHDTGDSLLAQQVADHAPEPSVRQDDASSESGDWGGGRAVGS